MNVEYIHFFFRN